MANETVPVEAEAEPGAGHRLLHSIDRLRLRTIAIAVGGLAFVLRVLYLALLTGHQSLTSDASQYNYLAINLAKGRGYVDTYPQIGLHQTAFRPPLYPALLSVVYRIFGESVGVGRFVNILIGTAVVVLVARLVFPVLGARAALAASVAAAIAPNLIANDTFILTEPLSLLLLVLLLGTTIKRQWVLSGLLTGLLILTRPSAQYLVVVLGVWFLVTIGWRKALMFMVLAGVVVAPWIARNWVELGSPVLVTSNGFNLAAMYSPPADERGAFVDPIRDPYWDDRRFDQLDEIVWDRNLRAEAVDNIKSDPTVVYRVVKRNFLAYFELLPSTNHYAEEADGRSMGVRNATLGVFYLTAVLGLVGFVRRWREPLVLLAIVIGGYFTAASLVFVAPPRLRSPLDLMLCIGVGACVAVRSRPEAEPESETETESEPEAEGETEAEAGTS
ncbi:MAG: glycosyltransferase family 39 protein [Acidimicrobiales bacterium]